MFDNIDSIEETKTRTSTKKSIAQTLRNAINYVRERQYPEGYWNAPLDTNCCMEAQWLL